jgi:ParE toxin of type II toxin-antitoxin system, parDE
MWSAPLVWRIEFDDGAKKDLAKLDKQIARRITAFLRERVAPLDDPAQHRRSPSRLKAGRFLEIQGWRLPHCQQHRRRLIARFGSENRQSARCLSQQITHPAMTGFSLQPIIRF